MNEQPLDGARFEDLVAAGVDERTIDVARALASARLVAPEGLAGMRWAAVAADSEPIAAQPAEPAKSSASTNERRRRPVMEVRGARRWWPQLLVGTAAVALVAMLWLWAMPWLSTTTIRRPEGRGDERPVGAMPTAPAEGEWSVVDQFGGNTRAFASWNDRLVIARGRRVEVYEQNDDDPSEPTMIGRSGVLDGVVTSMAIVGDRTFVTVAGRSELIELRLQNGAMREVTVTVQNSTPVEGDAPTVFGPPDEEPGGPLVIVVSDAEQRDDGTSEERSVWIADVTDENDAATLRQIWSTTDSIRSVTLTNATAYVAGMRAVYILDLTRSNRRDVLTLPDVRDATCVYILGRTLYVGGAVDDRHSLWMYALDSTGSPGLRSELPPVDDGRIIAMNGAGQDLYLALSGSLGNFDDSFTGLVERVNVRDPLRPRSVAYAMVPAEELLAWGDLVAASASPLAMVDGSGGQLHVWSTDLNAEDTWWSESDVAPPHDGSFIADPSHALELPVGLWSWDAGVIADTMDQSIGAMLHAERAGGETAWRYDQDRYVPAITYARDGETWTASGAGSLAMDARAGFAAALLARMDPGKPMEIAPIVWTPAEHPAQWPTDLDDLGERLPWMAIDLLAGDSGSSSVGSEQELSEDPSNWQLFLSDDLLVVTYQMPGSGRSRVLTYDITRVDRPVLRLNTDVTFNDAGAQPDGETSFEFPYAIQLVGKYLYHHTPHNIIAVDVSGTSGAPEVARIHSEDWFGTFTISEDRLVAAVNRELGIWRLSDAHLPTGDEPDTRIDLGLGEPQDANGSQLGLIAVDGNHAYVNVSNAYSEETRLLDVGLDGGDIVAETTLPGIIGMLRVLVDRGRIVVYSDEDGTYIIERRP